MIKKQSIELIKLFLNNTTIYNGNIDLNDTYINNLGILEHINGSLNLRNTFIRNLGNLEYVGGSLVLKNSMVESPGYLKYVGGDFDIRNSPLKKICYPDYEYAIREQYGIEVVQDVFY